MATRTAPAIFALMVAGGTVTGCESGTTTTTTQRPSPDNHAMEACSTEPSARIRTIFRFLHRTNEAEIRSANLAANRAERPEVREFAKRLITAHGSAEQKLLELARRERFDLSAFPEVDPVHAAWHRVTVEQEERLGSVSTSVFDSLYLGPLAEQHAVVLKVIEEGQKIAAGDARSLLDSSYQMAREHADRALVLIEDLRFAPAAVGGGPSDEASRDEPPANVSQPPRRNESSARSPRSFPEGPGEISGSGDAGVWPPITAPPERMPNLP
ncbi:MAG TPA: DUF4142 domain-containing protein [Polyangiaceae bacterium]